ncbi:MmcQ/YjbR family DNA-binding protein [Pontibacter sp. MBLB2868]|uniref:MmcQ/YjbR family DNA-binding protein n=1 Tax=Pontibacter sp. MBLB2868 TaxID=3451555 RepID=UPI003F75186F
MDIDILREYCLGLPGVTEDIKWGVDLCFMIGNKMFCVTSMEAPFTVSFKVQDTCFDELTESKDVVPAPYLARYKWVQVQGWSRFTEEEWKEHLQQSYELIKAKLPKKLLKML